MYKYIKVYIYMYKYVMYSQVLLIQPPPSNPRAVAPLKPHCFAPCPAPTQPAPRPAAHLTRPTIPPAWQPASQSASTAASQPRPAPLGQPIEALGPAYWGQSIWASPIGQIHLGWPILAGPSPYRLTP